MWGRLCPYNDAGAHNRGDTGTGSRRAHCERKVYSGIYKFSGFGRHRLRPAPPFSVAPREGLLRVRGFRAARRSCWFAGRIAGAVAPLACLGPPSDLTLRRVRESIPFGPLDIHLFGNLSEYGFRYRFVGGTPLLHPVGDFPDLAIRGCVSGVLESFPD